MTLRNPRVPVSPHILNLHFSSLWTLLFPFVSCLTTGEVIHHATIKKDPKSNGQAHRGARSQQPSYFPVPRS